MNIYKEVAPWMKIPISWAFQLPREGEWWNDMEQGGTTSVGYLDNG
jgi:hypothetical protein